MRRLDRRGVAAFEFCLVCVPLFTLMFVVFDLARYAITVQSLNAIANAQARYVTLQCYLPDEAQKKTTIGSDCAGTTYLLSPAQMQSVAPYGGSTATVSITAAAGGASPLTITATQPGFAMLVPVWGTTLNAPSVTSSIPF